MKNLISEVKIHTVLETDRFFNKINNPDLDYLEFNVLYTDFILNLMSHLMDLPTHSEMEKLANG